jgi:hypothetical protein
MRCAVCRCFLGAWRSASRIASMKAATGATRGFGRSRPALPFGTALAKASRISLRCTPNFRATPAIVPVPNSYSRRISSNRSTVALLLRMRHIPSRGSARRVRAAVLQGGPN